VSAKKFPVGGVGATEKRPKNSTIKPLSTTFVPCMKIKDPPAPRYWRHGEGIALRIFPKSTTMHYQIRELNTYFVGNGVARNLIGRGRGKLEKIVTFSVTYLVMLMTSDKWLITFFEVRFRHNQLEKLQFGQILELQVTNIEG